MAVTSASLTWDGRSGQFENVLDNNVTRSWLVKTDNKFDTELVVRDYFASSLGIVFLTPHPDNIFFTARRMSVNQKTETPFAWDVEVEYSTEPLDQDDEDDFENPLSRPTRISWGSEMVQRFVTKDKDDKALLNTAGQPFEPVEVDHVRWRLNIKKNLAAVPAWVGDYVNTVNQSTVPVQGINCQPRTLKLNALSISEQKVQNDVYYYEVSCSMAYDPKTWDVVLLNAGLVDGSGNAIQNADKLEVTEPWPLDASGDKIDTPTVDNVIYKTFKVFEEKDFNALPF